LSVFLAGIAVLASAPDVHAQSFVGPITTPSGRSYNIREYATQSPTMEVETLHNNGTSDINQPTPNTASTKIPLAQGIVNTWAVLSPQNDTLRC
jgi:hypothetical protein